MSNGNEPPAGRAACFGSTERRAAVGDFCVAIAQTIAPRRQVGGGGGRGGRCVAPSKPLFPNDFTPLVVAPVPGRDTH